MCRLEKQMIVFLTAGAAKLKQEVVSALTQEVDARYTLQDAAGCSSDPSVPRGAFTDHSDRCRPELHV